jgi:hypothetical protein
VLLKSPKVRFQQPKYSLGIQGVRARCPQSDYEALLPLHQTSRIGDVLLNTAKVIFQVHSRPHDPVGQ